MNIDAYISSGILEAYLLNELSPREAREVEQMVAIYPELKDELEAIESAMMSVAEKMKVQPPASLKAEILRKLESPATSGSVQFGYWKIAAAASIALFLISSVFAFFYWSNWKESSDELSDLKARNQILADQVLEVGTQVEQSKQDLAFIHLPATKRVELKGLDISPGSDAMVYWNRDLKQVRIAVNLPEPPPKEQYQLWALKDGKPIDMGVFEMDGFSQNMKSVGEADAFAVTLEPLGGSTTPTLEQMYLYGEVS